jgi:two-component sensor histidine kinase
VIPVETKLGLGTWDGQRVVIGLGRDLTERRKTEEQTASLREKTALLKEIHHRVKNNLQIISSLLSLQASQLKGRLEREPFRESQAQVQAIAMLHERLYKTPDLSRIDFGEYLGALAGNILRAGRQSRNEICLRLEMEPVWLGQDAAMPCGLIVNELVTNSCKYAFPDDQPGEIYLSAKHAPDDKLVLLVGDNGVGLPPGMDPRNSTTLGLQLVDDMVSQLKGSWTVEPAAGTLVRIVFPAERG